MNNEDHAGDRPMTVELCGIDALVESLTGKSFREILAGLDSATELHARLRQEGRAQRESTDVTRDYSAFAAGALFFLFHAKRVAPDFVPAGVSATDFAKLRPLVVDMAARGMAHRLLIDWLSATECGHANGVGAAERDRST